MEHNLWRSHWSQTLGMNFLSLRMYVAKTTYICSAASSRFYVMALDCHTVSTKWSSQWTLANWKLSFYLFSKENPSFYVKRKSWNLNSSMPNPYWNNSKMYRIEQRKRKLPTMAKTQKCMCSQQAPLAEPQSPLSGSLIHWSTDHWEESRFSWSSAQA